jgi:hypothetical protein
VGEQRECIELSMTRSFSLRCRTCFAHRQRALLPAELLWTNRLMILSVPQTRLGCERASLLYGGIAASARNGSVSDVSGIRVAHVMQNLLSAVAGYFVES